MLLLQHRLRHGMCYASAGGRGPGLRIELVQHARRQGHSLVEPALAQDSTNKKCTSFPTCTASQQFTNSIARAPCTFLHKGSSDQWTSCVWGALVHVHGLLNFTKAGTRNLSRVHVGTRFVPSASIQGSPFKGVSPCSCQCYAQLAAMSECVMVATRARAQACAQFSMLTAPEHTGTSCNAIEHVEQT